MVVVTSCVICLFPLGVHFGCESGAGDQSLIPSLILAVKTVTLFQLIDTGNVQYSVCPPEKQQFIFVLQ